MRTALIPTLLSHRKSFSVMNVSQCWRSTLPVRLPSSTEKLVSSTAVSPANKDGVIHDSSTSQPPRFTPPRNFLPNLPRIFHSWFQSDFYNIACFFSNKELIRYTSPIQISQTRMCGYCGHRTGIEAWNELVFGLIRRQLARACTTLRRFDHMIGLLFIVGMLHLAPVIRNKPPDTGVERERYLSVLDSPETDDDQMGGIALALFRGTIVVERLSV